MKVLNRSMTGAVMGVWCMPGDVVELPDEYAKELIGLGYAEKVVEKKAEKAAEPEVEHATVSEDVESAALTTENVQTPAKRRPGRPRKA